MFEMEAVEPRRMFAGDVHAGHEELTARVARNGTLHVVGTSAAERIEVRRALDEDGAWSGEYVVTHDGITSAVISEPVKRVMVQGRAGKDIIVVDAKQTVAVRLIGRRGLDRLTILKTVAEQLSADKYAPGGRPYPYDTDPATIPAKGLVTAYPVGHRTKTSKPLVNVAGGALITTAGTTQPDLNKFGETPFTTGVERAWSGKTIPSRPAGLTQGVYAGSQINDLLFGGASALTPSERPISIVVRESDGSGTAYIYDPKTDTVKVGIEQHFVIHFIDIDGNEVPVIRGRGYRQKIAIPGLE